MSVPSLDLISPLAGAWELGLVLSPSGGLDAETFKSALRHHPAGVALITADPGDGPVALTVTSLISISAEPPLVAFSLSDLSSATPSVKRAQTVVVHLLAVEDLELAKLGATSGVDRFADTSSWSRLPTGEPYFVAPTSRLRGRIVTSVTAGASSLIVVQLLDAALGDLEARRPLLYGNRTWYDISSSAVIA